MAEVRLPYRWDLEIATEHLLIAFRNLTGEPSVAKAGVAANPRAQLGRSCRKDGVQVSPMFCPEIVFFPVLVTLAPRIWVWNFWGDPSLCQCLTAWVQWLLKLSRWTNGSWFKPLFGHGLSSQLISILILLISGFFLHGSPFMDFIEPSSPAYQLDNYISSRNYMSFSWLVSLEQAESCY